MLAYEEANGHLPPAYIADKKTGKPLLSWRVAILPYIDQDALYRQFHLDEPWDSENNKKWANAVIAVYRSPASTAKPGMTNYLTVRGKDTVFPGKEAITPAQITDGMSNTIMVVEANDAKAVPWTKPDDYEYDREEPGGRAGRPVSRRLQRGVLRRLGAVHLLDNRRRDTATTFQPARWSAGGPRQVLIAVVCTGRRSPVNRADRRGNSRAMGTRAEARAWTACGGKGA